MISTYNFNKVNSDEAKVERNTVSVHFWWVIVVLLAVLIIQTALLCTDIQVFENRIMTFLSFTATLLSIVLSTFAIMYSFYSMQEASRQWSDVTKAVTTIHNYTDALSRSTQQVLEQVININRDLGSMQEKIKAPNKLPEIPKENTSNIRNVVNNTQRVNDTILPATRRYVRRD